MTSSEPKRPDAMKRDGWPDREIPVHLPVRQSLNRPVVVFVTACAAERKALFARREAHELLVRAWEEADAWAVGRYVVMPNHVHLFCAPRDADGPTLTQWVQYWKSLVSREWPWPLEQPIWQKSFWDRQLRRGETYGEK